MQKSFQSTIQLTTQLTTRLATLALLSSGLCACVVMPKQVKGYDAACMVATKKIELTVEQLDVFEFENCLEHSCSDEIFDALGISALTLTASTLVSGSIALAGNTLYWLESQHECMQILQPYQQPGDTPVKQPDERDLITEEIVTAKS